MFKRAKLVLCSVALASSAVPSAADAATFWQCAPFARMFSGIQLFGAAASWWNQAIGKYGRGDAPKAGAVLVFKAAGAMRDGHVATVSKIVSDRVIEVTHANWSVPGKVEHDVEVMDVSAKNDWSRVRVWFKGVHDLGTSSYPVYGFIYGGKAPARTETADAGDAKVASARPASLESDTSLRTKRAAAPLAALIG